MKIKKKFPKLMSALLAVVMILSALPMSAFAAAASDLPANMTDHSILRALEYTGYDVQQQIKDGTLYQSGSFGGNILGIGRNAAYAIVKKGYFSTVRIGGIIRISKRSFDAWLDEKSKSCQVCDDT